MVKCNIFISGITGELFAELLSNSLYNTTDANLLTEQQKTILKEYGGFASGISSLIVGKITDLDNDEIINNVYGGYRIGKNAVENNYLLPNEKGELMKELNNCGNDNDCIKQVQEKYEEISKPRDEEFKQAMNKCLFGDCEKFDKIHYDLRTKLTGEGNEYYLKQPEEFRQLPSSDSVFHTFQQDKDGNVINVTTGAEQGYSKYVHPIYGYEIVLDSNRDIVNNPLNIGTYNFYNPKLDGVEPNPLINGNGRHTLYDIIPYYMMGNSENDPSSTSNRLKRSFYYFNNK